MDYFYRLKSYFMKILKLIIPNFQQFRNFELDLTHPETGEALEKVCLIGTNGTGKSTILGILDRFLLNRRGQAQTMVDENLFCLIKFEHENNFFYQVGITTNLILIDIDKLQHYKQEKEFIKDVMYLIAMDISDFVLIKNTLDVFLEKYSNCVLENYNSPLPIRLKTDNSLIIFSPAESLTNTLLQVSDVPNTNINEALKLTGHNVRHVVSNETIIDFWTQLIFLIKQREENLSLRNLSLTSALFCALTTKVLYRRIVEKHPSATTRTIC